MTTKEDMTISNVITFCLGLSLINLLIILFVSFFKMEFTAIQELSVDARAILIFVNTFCFIPILLRTIREKNTKD